MKTFLGTILLLSGAAHAHLKVIPESENTQSLSGSTRELTSLTQIASAGLNSGASGIDLWSGSYWPQFMGSVGVRYRDPEFAALMTKEAQYKFFKELLVKKPAYSYSSTDTLSPAEKYDLLVGDNTMALTAYAWGLGEKNGGKEGGKVPTWRGICDGFASAAQMMPRPVRSVTLRSPMNQAITFYPEDIKALGSLSYARSQSNPIFLGKRCLSGALFFTDACDETNPGAFHKAIINRVGRLKKSFIADVSPGSEVWNYPVKSYEVSFFNVFSDEASADFKTVLETFDKKKKFSKRERRSKETAYIVGVEMKVNFVDMRYPHLKDIDDSTTDKVMEMKYVYDLELDRNFNILGGESTSKNLPDFIWSPNDRTYPLSDVEERNLVPSDRLNEKAALASKQGQPLASIIEKLFEASK